MRTSLINKTNYQDILIILRRKVFSGHDAISNLFNMSGPSFQASLDTSKCLDMMENFMMASRVVVNYKLQQFIEPSDVRQLARTMLLYRDQQNFTSELSKRNATTRFVDASTTRTRNMIALLRADRNTSVMDIPADDNDDSPEIPY